MKKKMEKVSSGIISISEKGDFITLLEEIQNGENAALEFKEAKRWDENLVKKS